MSYFASLNGQPTADVSLTVPLYGAWVADVTLTAATAIGPGPVALTIGPLTLAGAVYRADVFAGRAKARLVAGFGGWQKVIPAQAYQSPSGVLLSHVLGDAAMAVGEKVNVQTDGPVGAFFVRETAPASRTLKQLAGSLWWIDATGTTQIGPRPGLGILSDFQVIDYDPATKTFVVATEALADWVPGATFTSPTVPTMQTISAVILTSGGSGQLRLEVVAE